MTASGGQHGFAVRLPIIRAIALLNGLTMFKKPDLSNLSTYELDLSRGILKADGDEDHQRMMQAVSAD